MTSLKTVFAVIPSAQSVDCALAAFTALGVERGKLVGIHISPLAITYGLGTDIALADFIAAQMEAAEKERSLAEAAFAKACERAGIAHEWRQEKSPGDLLSPHAGSMSRAADLIVHPSVPEDAIGRHQVEEVVFTSGRPVLALPSGWSQKPLGERIVIAWDGGREAARAVFDAMPLLLKAKSARIVSVQGVTGEPVKQFTPGDDIAATLSRHGVRVDTVSVRSGRGSVGEELRVQMLDTGGDLLVMGCYGHSRFREMILGGVSREMLRQVPYPLLLAS